MGRVEHSAEGAATAQFAFDYTTDYRNVPKWMFGVSRFDPVTEQTRGVGATFETTVDLGPAKLPMTLRTTQWDEGTRFALETVKGITASCEWRFAPIGDERTTIIGIVDYSVGRGIAGRALDRIIQTISGPAIRHVEKHLRGQIEAAYAQRTAS